MPLNQLDLQPQIRQFAQNANRVQTHLEQKLKKALEQLSACAGQPHENWLSKIQSSAQRCALPSREAIHLPISASEQTCSYYLLAADGSQIIPSGHEAVPLALVNSSRVCLEPFSGQAPRVLVRSTLLDDHESGMEYTQLSEDLINLERDIAELRILADWQPEKQCPIIALRDGPLELYHEPHRGDHFEKAFQEYLQLLQDLSQREFILAGYIDRSRASLITTMLNLYAAISSGASIESQKPELPDKELMAALLPPGQRSAVFQLQSSASQHYSGSAAIYFFYLNIAKSDQAYVIRVEVPAWVAENSTSLALLQRALLDQCQIMGAQPYPYILHRAHEEAVVHFNEKEQLQNMLAQELQRQGLGIRRFSSKLSAKSLQNRTRM